MKKLIAILVSAAAVALSAFTVSCQSSARSSGVEMARIGQTKLTFENLGGTKAQLREALAVGLTERGWTIDSNGDPFKAHIDHRGQFAVVSADISDNKIVFETAGSKIGDEAYVPINYVNAAMKNVRKNLAGIKAR
ncbi:MAG: hypothetical protein IJI37_00035 [Opitutales bacterium]|nr:hypothetical protein [Opitutales bacterium]